MRTASALGFVALLAIAGCDQGAGSGAPGASAAPAGGGTKLTKDQLDEAYNLSDPDNFDKSLAAVKGKLGAPAKSDAESAVWYGLKSDGKTCHELKLTKKKGNEIAMVDMAACK